MLVLIKPYEEEIKTFYYVKGFEIFKEKNKALVLQQYLFYNRFL